MQNFPLSSSSTGLTQSFILPAAKISSNKSQHMSENSMSIENSDSERNNRRNLQNPTSKPFLEQDDEYVKTLQLALKESINENSEVKLLLVS